MLEKLRKYPLLTALLIVLLYALWFIVPMLLKGIDPNAKGISGIDGAMSRWSSELITATVLAFLVTLLGWWKKIGFRSIKKGGLKFILPIFILALVLLNVSWVLDTSNQWFLGFASPLQLFSLLCVILLLGFVEEGVFRGVFFYGLSTRFTALFTVIVTAVVFGLFHFVNLIDGATFNTTLYQALHAGAMGFLYASLRLRLGAVWPLMLMHGFWDFSIFVLQSTTTKVSEHTGDISMMQGLSIAAPAFIYGVFVYWQWSREENTCF